MMYILVRWIHDNAAEPILLFSELDGDRYETRKVEIFRGGRIALTGSEVEVGGSVLGGVPVPSLEEIASSPEFVPQEIGRDEFEAIWLIALQISEGTA